VDGRVTEWFFGGLVFDELQDGVFDAGGGEVFATFSGDATFKKGAKRG